MSLHHRPIWNRKIIFAALAVALCATMVALRAAAVDLLTAPTWTYSTDNGTTFQEAPPTISTRDKVPVIARTEFEVTSVDAFGSLELIDDLIPSWLKTVELNGTAVRPPQEVMYYNRFPGIDPGMLRPGRNTLAVRVLVDARRRDIAFRPTLHLLGIPRDDLAIEVGPVLGAITEDSFTVTCRTNMRASVHVLRGALGHWETLAVSEPGLFHRFRLPQPADGNRRYALSVAEAGRGFRSAPGAGRERSPGPTSNRFIEFNAPAYPKDVHRSLRFVVTSDPQSMVKGWTANAKAILATKPDFLVFGGDLIAVGRDDDAWIPEFFAPARELLAAIAAYTVYGNHEGEAPVVEEYFYGPTGPDGRAHNWVQQFGDVTLIGVDQWIHQEWGADSANARWLDQTLAAAHTKYVFLITHYPAYSSCAHGILDAKGQPAEIEILRAREIIVPLLLKHRATAMICGHDHYYERTEIPGGLYQIITGGGGEARDSQVKDALKQNPYSKKHASTTHYSLFEVSGGRCTLTARQPDGTLIDQLEFKPRF